MSWDLQGLLERIVDAEDTTQALERACGIVRDRLQATGAWVQRRVGARVVARRHRVGASRGRRRRAGAGDRAERAHAD